MFRQIRIAASLLLAPALSGAAPSIKTGGIVNAASYAGGSVSPGEIVAIFGQDLGPATLAPMELTLDGQFVTTSLAGTRVLFDEIPAPLIYASAAQIGAVVPFGVAGRATTSIRVEYRGELSGAVSLPVTRVRPGLFSRDSSGAGAAAALNGPDNSLNGSERRAPRGATIMLFGSAGGWKSPPAVDGKVATEALAVDAVVTATVSGVPATVTYAGAAPSLVTGMLQVNLVIPDAALEGAAVAVEIAVNGIRSQPGTTIAVGPPLPFRLDSPYTPQSRTCRGQLHAHSTESDGSQDPATVVRAYRDAGYDFMALTDHNKVTADPGVPGITFLHGIEQSPSGNHLNVIDVRQPPAWNWQTGQVSLDRILALGGIVFLNHPNWPGGYPQDPNWTDEELEWLNHYHGMEVWNSLVTPNSNAELRADYLLSRGRRIFLFGTDDCHNLNNANCRTGSTRVFAPACQEADILEGLRAGNFYASNGAVISAVAVSGDTFSVSTDEPAAIDFIGANRILHSARQVLSALYRADGTEGYIRARVTRMRDGRMAWTNPIYITRRAAAPPAPTGN